MTNWQHAWPFVVIALSAALLLLGHAASQLRHLRTQCRESWRELDGQLRQRLLLAPQLVSIASLYIPWNHHLLEDVTRCRLDTFAAKTPHERMKAETELSWALARLMLKAEDHRHLTRHADFAAIFDQLQRTENQVARLRLVYNRNVTLLAEFLDGMEGKLVRLFHKVEEEEPFELDPLLARQAMMAALEAGTVKYRRQSRKS